MLTSQATECMRPRCGVMRLQVTLGRVIVQHTRPSAARPRQPNVSHFSCRCLHLCHQQGFGKSLLNASRNAQIGPGIEHSGRRAFEMGIAQLWWWDTYDSFAFRCPGPVQHWKVAFGFSSLTLNHLTVRPPGQVQYQTTNGPLVTLDQGHISSDYPTSARRRDWPNLPSSFLAPCLRGNHSRLAETPGVSSINYRLFRDNYPRPGCHSEPSTANAAITQTATSSWSWRFSWRYRDWIEERPNHQTVVVATLLICICEYPSETPIRTLGQSNQLAPLPTPLRQLTYTATLCLSSSPLTWQQKLVLNRHGEPALGRFRSWQVRSSQKCQRRAGERF
ncbi:hypothetical protein LZ30DRAFT_393658 [Colletotrichum cereale]|nr:hypothetical protein LZ30DRAFT_393658 [Colletotrichum cereale]